MARPLAEALNGVIDRHGNIDEYVREELGYSTKEEMFKGLAAEQIDGIALAIDSIQHGKQKEYLPERQYSNALFWQCNEFSVKSRKPKA